MSEEIKLNLDRLFRYVVSCEMNDDVAKYYNLMLTDKDKKDFVDIVMDIRLSGRNTWSESAKAKIVPYLLKFAPVLYWGNSYIKPVNDLGMLDAEECYSLLSNWNFFISSAFFLYEKEGVRTLIMVEESVGVLTPKIIDPDNRLTTAQMNKILAEMHLLMAEQS